jgi:hypothetical protein
MKKRFLINVLIFISIITFFSAKPKPASAGEVITFIADPITGLVFADAVSCSINLIWGCDKNTGTPIDPCAYSGSHTAEWYPEGTWELCKVGTVKVINYFDDPTKPLEWQCNLGTNSKTCTAYVLPDSGKCSSAANGHSFYNLPFWRCSSGYDGPVTETDTDWKWTCLGTGPGTTDASCVAYKKFRAECGSATSNTYSSAPTDNLCAANNSLSQAPTYVPATDAYDYCAVYGLSDYSSIDECYADLGQWIIPANPARWRWTCARASTTKTCEALVGSAVAGSCGSSNGQSFATAPTANLCSDGSVPVVNGSGPWSWTCSGQNGGVNANCSAQKTCVPDYAYSCVKTVSDNCNNFANCGKTIVKQQANCVASDKNSCGLPLPTVSIQDCVSHGVNCESVTETCAKCTKDVDSWKEVNP